MIRITNNLEEANLITHSGNFHADDVFATAFLTKIIKEPVVYRLNNYNDEIKTDAIIYDIGGGKFDHHQQFSEYRDNGIIKYSSIGLLWKEFGIDYIKTITDMDPEIIFKKMDDNLILQIDAIDNGKFPLIEADYKLKTLSDVIGMFNPSWDNQSEIDSCFIEAVNFAIKIFDLELKKIISKLNAQSKVQEKIEKTVGPILILEKFMPFKDFVLESLNPNAKNIKFAIFPSQRGGYTIHTIPISKEDQTARLYFPQEWCGLRDQELIKKTEIETAIFVHPDGFIGGAKTLEDAIKMAQKALFIR